MFHELGHILLDDTGDRKDISRKQMESEAELFCSYWTTRAGYQYDHEIYIAGWLDQKINPLYIFGSVGGAVEKAEFILAEHFTEKDAGEVVENGEGTRAGALA